MTTHVVKSMTVREVIDVLAQHPPSTQVKVFTRTKDIENIRTIFVDKQHFTDAGSATGYVEVPIVVITG